MLRLWKIWFEKCFQLASAYCSNVTQCFLITDVPHPECVNMQQLNYHNSMPSNGAENYQCTANYNPTALFAYHTAANQQAYYPNVGLSKGLRMGYGRRITTNRALLLTRPWMSPGFHQLRLHTRTDTPRLPDIATCRNLLLEKRSTALWPDRRFHELNTGCHLVA